MDDAMDDGLRAYAARLLAGTGLDGGDAEAVASQGHADIPERAATAAAAMRDGWAVAARTAGQS